MARYDKYDPYSGGFRAPLAADFGTGGNSADLGKIWAVGLNASGQIVKAVASADTVGLLVLTQERYAGQVVDVMTHGEIVDVGASDNVTGGVAGGPIYAAPGGALNATATAQKKVGFFVEASRLIVRVPAAGTGA